MALLGYCLAVAVCRVPRYSQTNPKHKAVCCMRRADKRIDSRQVVSANGATRKCAESVTIVSMCGRVEQPTVSCFDAAGAVFGGALRVRHSVCKPKQASSMNSPTYAV